MLQIGRLEQPAGCTLVPRLLVPGWLLSSVGAEHSNFMGPWGKAFYLVLFDPVGLRVPTCVSFPGSSLCSGPDLQATPP